MPTSTKKLESSASSARQARVRLAQLLEEKAKRHARSSLVAFTKWTFPPFKENWHHKVIAEWLEKLHRRPPVEGFSRGLDGLMIFAPPRHTKSEIATVRRPAWSIGRDPARMFMLACYGQDLANDFSVAIRNTMQDEPYQRLWAVQFRKNTDQKWQIVRPVEVENQRPSMIAGGITAGKFTGGGATDFIIDDPFKNQQEAWSKGKRDNVWNQYLTAARTRLQPG